MADVELTSINVKIADVPLTEQESKLPEEKEYVKTRYGNIFVTFQGNPEKPAFITFADIGLNSQIQYHGFFNYLEMQPLMESFCVYHINALGQEENSPSLPSNYSYPTCEQLAETVLDVVNFYKLKSVICFGVGLGANVLARFALTHPDMVNACIFINCVTTKCGWIEWGYQKWNRWYLGSGQYTDFTNNYLLWHHFGYNSLEHNHDLVETYSRIFPKINPVNLGLLVSSYISRTDLGIERHDFEHNVQKFNFKCSVLNITGDSSPHEDDVVETNGRLDPTKSAFVKFSDCGGLVLEEQPAKVAETLRHFLQGLGYVPHLSITRYSLANRNSDFALRQKQMLQKNRASIDNGVAISTISLEENAHVPSSFNETSFKNHY